MIKTKRAYEPSAPDDGPRYLVDRLWPRGVKKEALELAGWLKEISPSDDLRREFHHEPEKWDEFRRGYFAELDARRDDLQPIRDAAQHGDVTLVYAARDEEHNNAVALKEYLERNL
jgi:uncharacterized protein YeaO (DUF488 family)